MKIDESIRNHLREEIWKKLRVSFFDTKVMIDYMVEENYYQDVVQSLSDVDPFIDSTLRAYLFPKDLSRLKNYDEKFLRENDIELSFVKVIADGWDVNLYFDKKNNLFWEDHYGRYSKEGYIISPYVNPLSIYK